MRIGTHEKVLWVVVDPTPQSTPDEILFQASLADHERQFRGGLKLEHHPTLFIERREAEVEAFGRVTAMRAARAITERVAAGTLPPGPHRLEIRDGEGKLLFDADLG